MRPGRDGVWTRSLTPPATREGKSDGGYHGQRSAHSVRVRNERCVVWWGGGGTGSCCAVEHFCILQCRPAQQPAAQQGLGGLETLRLILFHYRQGRRGGGSNAREPGAVHPGAPSAAAAGGAHLHAAPTRRALRGRRIHTCVYVCRELRRHGFSSGAAAAPPRRAHSVAHGDHYRRTFKLWAQRVAHKG